MITLKQTPLQPLFTCEKVFQKATINSLKVKMKIQYFKLPLCSLYPSIKQISINISGFTLELSCKSLSVVKFAANRSVTDPTFMDILQCTVKLSLLMQNLQQDIHKKIELNSHLLMHSGDKPHSYVEFVTELLEIRVTLSGIY